MWIVNLALRRPYTFIVLAIFILIAGVLAILRTPKDIFPSINIPVISVIWNYAGLTPQDMEEKITWPYERVLTTTVDNIEHIESQSLYGIGVVKIFLQPTATVPTGIAQVTSVSQAILRQLPPGITPPLVLSYSATNVPVLRVGLSGQGLSEQQLGDLGLNFVRTQLITVPGVAVPYPYGGKQRYVAVDLNYQALQSRGLTPTDVVNAVNAQNLTLPAGTAKIAELEYQVGLNSSPRTIDELNAIPVKTVGNTVIYVRDVANIRDGFIPQTNVVRFNGQRASMLDIQKIGNASTLDIVAGVKKLLPELKKTLPDNLNLQLLTDQSIFVTAAIEGVIREGVIAACLTALMILIFLGDFRSTIIIAISIPLAILCSIVTLRALGETINIMTLGGLALAVGILVDDATVTIENIDRHLAEGKPKLDAIRDGAAQIAVPALVSTLCICIVFVPIFFLSGVAKYLFAPLAEAVIFAMLASYILSRTLVPTLAMYWMKEVHPGTHGHAAHAPSRGMFGWFGAFHRGFERRFEAFREGYRDLLGLCLRNAGKVVTLVVGFSVVSLLLFPFLGQNFFPSVDAGRFDLHVRMKTGMRIEETARNADLIEQMIRQVIPANQLQGIIDNLGIPYSGINLSYNNTGTMSAADGDILVSLNENHDPTDSYIQKIRTRLQKDFPGVGFWFPPADIVAQILNFGLPAPLDIQVIGANRPANAAFARNLMEKVRRVAGAVDVRIQEPTDAPRLNLTVDRSKAALLGLTQTQVANSVLGALAGSQTTAPNFWVDPKNSVNYQINAMAPQYDMDSLDAVRNLPILGGTGQTLQILGNVADISRSATFPVADHFNIRPVTNIYANVSGRDLGAVAADVQKLIAGAEKDLPKGSSVVLRGQIRTMNDSFVGLYLGLLFSMVLVYLLMVVNFQSWIEPLIIITALPCALAGIVWVLFITHTTLSVPALMGAIMCMGVATANSVLVVTFANEQQEEFKDSYRSALQAGYVRLRPVLMTALAMIIGMVPMALGLGEGGEQNAPLGRAVIGGLLFATTATLFFVPTVFMLVRRGKAGHAPRVSPEAEPAKS
ncbi:MAG: efflux RND transporter permease subunit [Verrucomicrobia bacterium]|nr:efflux RND transporter permease subunit [Verrucomicrobiota bacterium]